MPKQKRLKRVCFDIETELFNDIFRRADTAAIRLKHAPKMRVACAFDGVRWRYFLPSEAAALVKLLASADEIITFNGLAFDELVLRRHHGLKGKLPLKGKHVDLCAIIHETKRRRVSLHRLAELNLGEPKHTKGRSMANLDIEGLKIACRSDVWQTYRLWHMWCNGGLKIPEPREREDWIVVGPGHHIPALCPRCHAVNTLILIEYDMDEMSEGQQADYLAGVSGTAVCDACEHEFDWEM
jgi:hypothetical protein